MNLNDIVPDYSVRKIIYRVFAAIGVILGVIQVGFASADAGQPTWLTVSLAIYAFLGSAGFTMSQSRTSPESDTASKDDAHGAG